MAFRDCARWMVSRVRSDGAFGNVAKRIRYSLRGPDYTKVVFTCDWINEEGTIANLWDVAQKKVERERKETAAGKVMEFWNDGISLLIEERNRYR